MRLARVGIAILILLLVASGIALAGEPFDRRHQVGLSVGTPAGLNLEYSYEFGNRAIYASGMYYGSDELYGFQAGVSLERGGTSRKHFSLNLVVGDFFIRRDSSHGDDYWAYGGFEAYLRYRRVFLAPVISFGNGELGNASSGESNFHGPVIMGRLGLTLPL